MLLITYYLCLFCSSGQVSVWNINYKGVENENTYLHSFSGILQNAREPQSSGKWEWKCECGELS